MPIRCGVKNKRNTVSAPLMMTRTSYVTQKSYPVKYESCVTTDVSITRMLILTKVMD